MELLASQRAGGVRPRGMIDAVQIDYHVTPFRAERFYELYYPAIRRPLTYGATQILFYRSEEDSDYFVHMVMWEDRAGFERWWFSQEMQEMRVTISGLHGQPLVPRWNTILEQH